MPTVRWDETDASRDERGVRKDSGAIQQGYSVEKHPLNRPPAIPKSVDSRTNDNATTGGNNTAGIRIETYKKYEAIGATISNSTTGFSTAYLEDGNYNSIATTDISSLSAGDAFGFENVDLPAGTYIIYVNCADAGYADEYNYPYGGNEIDITGHYNDGNAGTGQPRGVNDVGNPQSVLI